LADKLDTLGRFFAEELYPTSSKDPFALRRAALGVLKIIIAADLSLDVFEAVQVGLFGQVLDLERRTESNIWRRVYTLDGFFKDRLEQMLRDDGLSPGLVRAVLEEGNIGFRPKRAVAAARSLQAFVATDDGTNLLAGYKRAANILKIEAKKDDPSPGSAAPSPTSPSRGEVEPAESALALALDAALPAAAAAVAAEEFGAAMTALAGLRAPVDRFFADVMVNDPDPAVRAERLALLGRFRDAVHAVADFSKVEG